MYADRHTKSIEKCMQITSERRKIQEEFNRKHGIVPQTIKKGFSDDLGGAFPEYKAAEGEKVEPMLDPKEIEKQIEECQKEMKMAAKELRFEDAARFRDLMKYYQDLQLLEDHPL